MKSHVNDYFKNADVCSMFSGDVLISIRQHHDSVVGRFRFHSVLTPTRRLPVALAKFYYPPEVGREEYNRGLGVFLLQYFPLVKR